MGNEAVSSEQIVQAVAESGIKRGANIKKIDLKSAEERTMVLLPGLSSISISNMGTTVVVEVKEVREKLPVVDPSQPCNLVAAKKGRITRVLALEGNAAVKVGEYVTEGQLLVTGVYEDRWGKALFLSLIHIWDPRLDLNCKKDVQLSVRALRFKQKKRARTRIASRPNLELLAGLEPAACALRVRCSTN